MINNAWDLANIVWASATPTSWFIIGVGVAFITYNWKPYEPFYDEDQYEVVEFPFPIRPEDADYPEWDEDEFGNFIGYRYPVETDSSLMWSVNSTKNMEFSNDFFYKYSNNFELQSSPWQINFQDPATPIADRIIEIHHHVFFFLVVVLIFVSWMLFRVLNSFWYIIPDNKSFSRTDLKTLKLLSRLRFSHNTTIEVIWTSIPSLILVAIAIPSFGLLYAMDDVIDPEVTIKAIGHQWYWSYEYSDYHLDHGTISFDSYMIPDSELKIGQLRLLEVDNSIVLPMGVYIRLNVSAADVLHCWAVPSLGIKIDAVPHRINSGVIFLQRLGTFYGQCSEICGVNHGFMPIAVKSVTLNNYLEWINNKLA